MPISVSHALTATTPDDPAYEIRPSHWNSAHVAVMSATAGTEIYGAFSNDPAFNVSFSTNGAGQVVASANVTAAPSPVNVTGVNGSSVNAQTIAFSQANGLTLGVSTAANGATVTGSYTVPTQSVQTQASGNIARTGYTSTTQGGSTVGVTHDTQGLSVAWPAFLTTSPAVPTAYVSSVNGSSGAISLNVGSSLSSSTNGSSITFGLASNITTALQPAGNYLTTARASNDAIGLNSAVSNVTATINSSGLSLDARGYAGTATAITGGAAITLNSGGMSFNGSGLAGVGTSATNASITLNSAGLAISVAAPGGAASQTLYATGNTTVNSSGTMALSSLLMRGYGIVSLGTSNGSILVSAPDSTSYNAYSVGFSTGGNTAGDTGFGTDRVVFAGGANITLSGSTNAGSATISIVGGAGGGGGGAGLSAGTQSVSTGTVAFADSNGITFGMSGSSQITASHNGLTSQSNQAVSAANGSYAFQTLSFSNANGISFGTSAGSAITASHNGLTTARASNDAVGLNTAQSNVTWTVNSSGLSLDARGYAGTATAVTGAASLTVNSAGVSFNGSNLAGVGTTFNGTNASASMTLNSAGLRLDLSAAAGGGGGVTPVASASNGSFSFTTLGFSNANNVTFGTSAGSIITASVAAPGAAAENNWVNLLGANTAGNTTASGSTIGYSGINLTLSGTNGSVVNISAPATSSLVGASGISISTDGSTISVYNAAVLNNFRAFEKGNNTSFSSFGQNTVYFQHFIPEDVIQFSSVEIWARGSFVSSTNSQVYAQTIRYGIYSQETGASSTRMTLAGSSSNVIQVSYNSNTAAGFTVQDGATSYTTTSGGTAIIANVSGPFHHYMPFSSTLQPNVKHALAVAISSATTVGTSPFRYAPLVQTVQNSLSYGRIFNTGTQATATTVIGDREMGVYSATSGALPSSYATSQISIAVSRQQLPFMLEG